MAAALLSYSGRTLFEQGELQSETTFYPLRASAPLLPETRTRTQSNCGPGAGRPTLDTTPAPGREPPALSEGEDAARPQSFPWRILPQREDLTSETRPLTPGTVSEHRPPPDLGRHHRKSQEWWPRTYSQQPERPRLPRLTPLAPGVLISAETSLDDPLGQTLLQ